MTLPPHIAKLRDELLKKANEGEMGCFTGDCPHDHADGCNQEILKYGFDHGYLEAKKQAEGLVDAIRHTLGEFALYNEEEDASKWPKFILKCEKNLAAYREKMGE